MLLAVLCDMLHWQRAHASSLCRASVSFMYHVAREVREPAEVSARVHLHARSRALGHKDVRIHGFSLLQLFLLFVGNIYCNCWNNCWMLIVLRLTKSGIEYVILAASSFFSL